MSEVHVFILSGGAGTRLWPLSTPQIPKQFHNFNSGSSLFEKCFERARNITDKNVWVVTGEAWRDKVLERIPAYFRDKVLIEPESKNTAGAITWAIIASHINPEDVMVVLPSDHLIDDVSAFVEQVNELIEFSRTGYICLLGVTPDKVDPSLGYIIPGNPLRGRILEVKKFVEKPDAQMAVELIRQGALWNSGIFVLTAKNAEQALSEHSVYHAEFFRAVRNGIHPEDAFKQMPPEQFDRAVLEKADNLAVMKAEFRWSDLGTWETLAEKGLLGVWTKQCISVNSGTSLGFSLDGRPVVIAGVENVIVVSGSDGVLVARKGDSKLVSRAVQKLYNRNSGGK